MSVRLVQSALPTYRAAFLTELVRRMPDGLDVYVGDSLFDETVLTARDLPIAVRQVNNIYLGGRRVLWQRGVVAAGIAADVAVLELNPRILSVWATVIIRRVLKRPTILWGHAWPRRGRYAPTDRLRAVLRRVADVLITYTATQAQELKALMPNHRVQAAPNAIYHAAEMEPAPVGQPQSFIYVGRLVPEKKPELLLDAFARAAGALEDMRLVVVGDGPEREKLETRARNLGIAHRVDLLGEVTDIARLRSLYACAVAAVSPGYVGLSLVQSLGFGVPIIVADAEPHAPEIEAAISGVTARFFAADSASDLADAMVQAYQERDEWRARREEISTWCRERYSVERMVDGFVEAIRYARSKREAGLRVTGRGARANG